MGKNYTLKHKRKYDNRNCLTCGTVFMPKSSGHKNCTSICSEKYALKKKNSELNLFKKKYFDMRAVSAKSILKLVKNTKLKITDERTQAYDSPTGRVYIGIAKKPLAEVKDGFGFKGVLLQTDNRMFIQCHVCGKWLRKIPKQHLEKHNLTKEEYNKLLALLHPTITASI